MIKVGKGLHQKASIWTKFVGYLSWWVCGLCACCFMLLQHSYLPFPVHFAFFQLLGCALNSARAKGEMLRKAPVLLGFWCPEVITPVISILLSKLYEKQSKFHLFFITSKISDNLWLLWDQILGFLNSSRSHKTRRAHWPSQSSMAPQHEACCPLFLSHRL